MHKLFKSILVSFLLIGCSYSKPTNPNNSNEEEQEKTVITNEELVKQIDSKIKEEKLFEGLTYNDLYVIYFSSRLNLSLYKNGLNIEIEFERIEDEEVSFKPYIIIRNDNLYSFEFTEEGKQHEVSYTIQYFEDSYDLLISSMYSFDILEDGTLKTTHSISTPSEALLNAISSNYKGNYEALKKKLEQISKAANVIIGVLKENPSDFSMGNPNTYDVDYEISNKINEEMRKEQTESFNKCLYVHCEEKSEEYQKISLYTNILAGYPNSFVSTNNLEINNTLAWNLFSLLDPYVSSDYNCDQEKYTLINQKNSEETITLPREFCDSSMENYLFYNYFYLQSDFQEIQPIIFPDCILNQNINIEYDGKTTILREKYGVYERTGDSGDGPEVWGDYQYLLDYVIKDDLITAHVLNYKKDMQYGLALKDKFGNTYLSSNNNKSEKEVLLEHIDTFQKATIVLKDNGEEYYQIVSYNLE